jgi:hypothetical protein
LDWRRTMGILDIPQNPQKPNKKPPQLTEVHLKVYLVELTGVERISIF